MQGYKSFFKVGFGGKFTERLKMGVVLSKKLAWFKYLPTFL